MKPSTESRAVRSRLSARVLVSALAAVAVVLTIAFVRPADHKADSAAAASQPQTPQFELLHAERFQLAQPTRHVWRADKPAYTSGWLLVLAGDEQSLAPRQAKMPVLYVGNQTAERINTAQGSGKLVVLVPGDFALAGTRVFLGNEALPEELLPASIDAELGFAIQRGLPPLAAASIANATQPGTREFQNDFLLRRRAIELVAQHSPGETDLIATLDVPYIPPAEASYTAPR
jgi:hypothetical protein